MVIDINDLPERLVVPLLCSAAETEHAVRRHLGLQPGLCVEVFNHLVPWAERAAVSGVALADVAMLDRHAAETWRQLWSSEATRPEIVAVARDPRAAAAVGGGIEAATAIVLSLEGRDLGYALARALIVATGGRLRQLLDTAPDLPVEVRVALRRLTRRVIPGPGWEDERPPPRHIKELAYDARVSRAQFHRRRRQRPVHVRSLAEVWMATQAVCIKALEGPSLERLADRSGYGSRTGLCALGERALGIPAGAWSETWPTEVTNICTVRWSIALLGAS